MITSHYLRLKGFLSLIRPFTLLVPLIVSISIMIASLFYHGRGDELSILFLFSILPAGIILGMLNAASNTLNQATDVQADIISKPYRPIPKGLLSPREVIVIAFVLYTFSLISALFLDSIFGLFVFLITLFTLTYSLSPRMKDKLFLNQLWVAIPRGLLGVLASWSLFGSVLEPLPLAIGTLATLFLVGGSITKDIADSDADKITGTHTLVNTFGPKKAAFIAFPFLFFPFTFIPILINLEILEQHFWILTGLAILGYLIFYFMIKEDSKTTRFENTRSWMLMYFTYFLFASSFSLLTVLSCCS